MTHKTCKTCHESKPIEAFLVRDKAKGTLRTECKACQSATRADNKDRMTAYNKAYHAANAEKMSLRNKAYHEANRDKLLPSMRVRNLARYHSDDAYMASVLTSCATSRAPSKRFAPAWADSLAIEAVYSYAAQLRRLGITAEVDHIIPIKSPLVCGLHVHENLRVVTRAENRKKKNVRWPTDMPYAETPFSLPL